MTTVNLNNPLGQNPANVPANSVNPNIAPRPAGAPTPRLGGAPVPPPPAPRSVNPQNGQRPAPQKASNSNTGAKVAVAGAAAAVAGGATAATVSMLNNDTEEPITSVTEEPVEENNNETNPADQTTVTPAATTSTTGNQPAGSQTGSNQPAGPQTGTNPPADSTSTDTPPADQPINTPPADQPIDPPFTGEDEPLEEPIIEDPEDTELMAEASISGDEVDGGEIRMEGDIAFTEVRTVYTVEGDEVTAATFHDAYDNEMVMVDLDNDGYFDYAENDYGYQADVSHLAMSVSDAEEQVTEGYLAQSENEIETFENEFGDDYLDDIITV